MAYVSLRLHPVGVTLALAAAVVVGGAVPAVAPASFIVFRCGASFENLCRIAPDGSAKAQLTSDGQPDPGDYASPSLSRDGSRLAFRKGDKLFVGDASATAATQIDPGNNHRELALRPDGLKVASIEISNVFGPRSDAYAINSDGSGTQFVHTTALTVGWLGNRLLSNPSTETKSVCAYLYENDERTCERTVASDPARDLFHPTGSPDGAFVAAAAVAPSDSAGVIAIYDQATGALVRDLTSGTSDSWPAYSPDGSRIAFQRGDSIFVTPASGAAPAESRRGVGASTRRSHPPCGSAASDCSAKPARAPASASSCGSHARPWSKLCSTA
jgi:dipeptidyl aminopeptidase/acylaminoacyl peptidase